MYITFETTDSRKITIDITRVQSWDSEDLVRTACEQLGTDYVDFSRKSKKLKGVVTPINWKPLINNYRSEMVTLKRPPRKFVVPW
jgi:hypothetical protein